jgi:Lrp/AsnC family transcriptional regulator, leucine-responsive regulatory protein
MDETDLQLLAALTANARASYAELAAEVGLSGPSTADRVRRLEERGVIRGYAACVDPVALGRDLTAFIFVTVGDPAQTRGFVDGVGAFPEVVECHHLAGDDDYLLKVHVDGTRGLEAFVTDRLKMLAGVVRTRSTVVLSTAVERPVSVTVDG